MDKPQYVLDRTAEWASLVRFVERGGSPLRLGLLSGRRRHGKSYLLRALADAYGGLYIGAVQEEGARQARARFADAIAAHAGLPSGSVPAGDWEELLVAALEVADRQAGQGRGLLVIDEFPYLLTHSPQIPSLLQHIYDGAQQGRGPNGRLILCGSAMSVMSELLSGTKPLRGRAVLDMRLGPFDYRQAADLWGTEDLGTATRLHAILGGAPGYRQLVQDDLPTAPADFDDWVVENLLDPTLGLFTRNETEYLLREDPRITQRVVYYEILSAVANGATTPAKVGGLIGRERTSLSYPIDVLLSSGYLNREDDLIRQRKPTLTVADPIIRFNQLVTVPFTDQLDRGRGREVWRAVRPTFASQILGPHFEELARTFTALFAEDEVGIPVGAVGSTDIHDRAGRATHEVDVLALAPGSKPRSTSVEVTAIGEAKATARPRGVKELERLDHIRALLVEQGHDAASARTLLFSENGFTRDLEREAAGRADVTLIDLARLYGRGGSLTASRGEAGNDARSEVLD